MGLFHWFLCCYACCLYMGRLLIFSINFVLCYFAKFIINCRNFLVESLGSFMYRTILSAIKNILTFSCLILSSLSPSLQTLSWTGMENGHPCLIAHSSRNTFSFSLLCMMLAVGLWLIAFIIMRYIPCMLGFSRTLIMKDVGFCQRTFLQLMKWSSGFCSWVCLCDGFKLLMFCTLNHLCISEMRPAWLW